MRRNRRVTLLCYDPRQPLHYLEVRGMVAEMTEAGGRASRLPRLEVRRAAGPLLRRRHPASFAETETPVLCRIRPTHVVALNATGPTRRDGGGMEAHDRSHRASAASSTSLAPGPADPADLRCVHDTGS